MKLCTNSAGEYGTWREGERERNNIGGETLHSWKVKSSSPPDKPIKMLHTPDRLALPSQDPFLLIVFVWFALPFFFSGWLYNVGVCPGGFGVFGVLDIPLSGAFTSASQYPRQIHSLPCIYAQSTRGLQGCRDIHSVKHIEYVCTSLPLASGYSSRVSVAPCISHASNPQDPTGVSKV